MSNSSYLAKSLHGTVERVSNSSYLAKSLHGTVERVSNSSYLAKSLHGAGALEHWVCCTDSVVYRHNNLNLHIFIPHSHYRALCL